MQEFRGIGYLAADLDMQLIAFIFCMPFFLLVFLFRDLGTYKYTFEKNGIIKHYILGFTKKISRDKITTILNKKSDGRIEIHWRDKPHASTRIITIFHKSLEKTGLQADETTDGLISTYCR